MYAVVGCSKCSNLWIVEGQSASSTCPRCGSRRPSEKRRRFLETEDLAHARDVRASMLANRQGHGEAFADLESSSTLDERVADGLIDDDALVEAHGLHPEAVANATEDPRGSSTAGSRTDIIERALDELDRPTETEVVEYACAREVPASYTRRALEKLARNGDVVESDGRYRKL